MVGAQRSAGVSHLLAGRAPRPGEPEEPGQICSGVGLPGQQGNRTSHASTATVGATAASVRILSYERMRLNSGVLRLDPEGTWCWRFRTESLRLKVVAFCGALSHILGEVAPAAGDSHDQCVRRIRSRK